MKAIGDTFERRAANLLQQQGRQILERNFRARTGEIDIIARDGGTLVFIEVRARRHSAYAGAAASVTRGKQRRLLNTAALYLRARPSLAQAACRFDVIAFEPRQSRPGTEIHWIRRAFTA